MNYVGAYAKFSDFLTPSLLSHTESRHLPSFCLLFGYPLEFRHHNSVPTSHLLEPIVTVDARTAFLRVAIDCVFPVRAVMIPGLESAPEYDRSMILKFVSGDSSSGSFQLDPLESAPVLESAPLFHCWSFLNQEEPVIYYFDVPN